MRCVFRALAHQNCNRTICMKNLTFAAVVVLSALPSQALSENCRALPAGPERRACAMRENPERFQALIDHCKQLARERGSTGRTATGAGGPKEFIRDCMQGKQR
jgi:hypothetical protein